MSKPRTILADDHTLLIDAFRTLLADDCDVVGVATNGRELLEVAASTRPEIAVVDVSMPLLNGLDAVRQLKQIVPSVRVVFVTMNEDPDVAAEAFRAGASGYLLKRSAGTELRTAIAEVWKGRSYITPLVAGGLMESMIEPRRAAGADALTPRQREVVQLIAEGRSLKEIAAVLEISPRTAAFHKYRIMEVLRTPTTADLIQFAVKHHIV